jgi:hypothetical protein
VKTTLQQQPPPEEAPPAEEPVKENKRSIWSAIIFIMASVLAATLLYLKFSPKEPVAAGKNNAQAEKVIKEHDEQKQHVKPKEVPKLETKELEEPGEMHYHKLKKFVDDARAKGHTEKELRSALKKRHWDKDTIDRVFKK